MKKGTLILLILFTIKLQAQDYLIAFTAHGTSAAIDSVLVENLTQCKDTVVYGNNSLNLVGIIGINENDRANNYLRVFPNPMSDLCIIEYEAASYTPAYIELYDSKGMRLIQEQTAITKGINKFQLSGLNNGLYFIKISADKYSSTSKIVSTNDHHGKPRIQFIESMLIERKINYTSNAIDLNIALSEKAIIKMQYTNGDILKYTGFSSGKYRTIFMQVPTNSQTIDFNFVTCVDADSNHYAVIQIGTQLWMAENLKTTKYNTGVAIGTTTPANLDINSETSPKYQWVYDGSDTNLSVYGRLYTWFAVTDSRNIAPAGWHAPTDAEWTTLTNYLGDSDAGGKMKENCSSLWISPNTGATNESGFTGLPGGYRVTAGNFDGVGYDTYFWSSTVYNVGSAHARSLSNDHSNMSGFIYDKRNGYYLRCIKD